MCFDVLFFLSEFLFLFLLIFILFSLPCLYMCCWCFPLRCLFQCLFVCLVVLLFYFELFNYYIIIVSTMHTFFLLHNDCSKFTHTHTHTHIMVMKSFLIRVARVIGNTFFFRFGIVLYFVFAFLFVVFQVLISIVCFLLRFFVVVVYLFSF